MVKFGYTIVYVADVERSLAFFEAAFAMSRRFITAEKDYGELENWRYYIGVRGARVGGD